MKTHLLTAVEIVLNSATIQMPVVGNYYNYTYNDIKIVYKIITIMTYNYIHLYDTL